MADIKPYTEHVAAQGQLNVQASPNDFGAQVGAAFNTVGAGINSVAEAQYKIEQDEGQIWGYKAAGDAYNALRQELNDRVNSLDPNASDFQTKLGSLTDEFSQRVEQSTADLMGNAPTRSAQKAVAAHMASNGRALIGHAITEQARVSGEYTAAQITATTKQDQDAIAADPSDGNFQRILENRRSMIGALNNIPPEKKIEWISKLEHNLAVTQVGVQAATDPDFLKKVSAQGGSISPGQPAKGEVPGGAPTAPGSAFDSALGFIFKKEGGYKDKDGNSNAPVNFGINQRANPDVDVKNLTKDGAAQIYRDRYWNAIGGDSLPANMATVAMNAAVNMGVEPAKALLAKAGGDPAAFTSMVKDRYAQIVANDPSQAKYLKGWLARADEAAAAVTSLAASPGSSLPQVETLPDAAIMTAKPPIAGWGNLTWTEKVAAVRQAEAIRGASLAAERGEITKQLTDINATLLAGKSYPGLDDGRFSKDNLTRVFGPDAGPRAFDQIQYAKQVGTFVTQMATMPVAQAASYLKSMEPTGGPEFAAKNPVYQQAVAAFQQVQKARDKDYIAWAQSNPGTNVKPLDLSDPDKFRESIAARIPAAIAGKQDYGADSHVLSEAEAGQLGDLLNRMNPQDQTRYLTEIRKATAGHDEWFLDAMSQIAPKNTMLAFAAVTSTRQGSVQTAAGAQDGSLVGQYILEGAHILQAKDLNDPAKSGKPFNVDDNVLRKFFWNHLGTNAFASPDASRSAQMAEDTYQAAKNYMVADMYHRGMTPDKLSQSLVENAVNAVTGGTVKNNGSTLFLPWGMSKGQFEVRFPWALDAALTRSGIKGTPLDAPDGYQYLNVGDGKYQIAHGNKALVGRDGRAVIIDMSRDFGARAGRGFMVPEQGMFGGLR